MVNTVSAINTPILSELHKQYNDQCKTTLHVAQNAITHASASKVMVDTAKADRLHTTFSDELDVDTSISDQQQSGRCWIFSFLNVLRAHFVHKYDLPSTFEFSPVHLFFWDQFEKSNQFLHYMWDLRKESTDHEIVRELLKEPISDGGQWHMLQNLVSKYGIVPKHCMNETYQANNTSSMSKVVCAILREYACIIRRTSEKDLSKTINDMRTNIYNILCVHLGEPPQRISWEYNPSDTNWKKKQWKEAHKRSKGEHTHHTAGSVASWSGHHHTTSSVTKAKKKTKKASPHHDSIDKKPFEHTEQLTPLEFYKKYVKVPIEDYVTVINYPNKDRPFNRTYTVRYLNNVVGGRCARLYNYEINDLKRMVMAAIDAGDPTWFCADVDKDASRKYGILDPDSFNYTSVFKTDPHGWDKGTRMQYKEGIPNHAMVLRGYHIENPTTESKTLKRRSSVKTKKKNKWTQQVLPTRWLVENSWGEYSGKDGNLVMSDTWFDRHVYEIAIHKKHLLRPPDTKPVIKLDMWDVFGTLFK